MIITVYTSAMIGDRATMENLNKLVTVAMLYMLAGCAGQEGNTELARSTKAELYQTVYDKITTKSDARRLLGDPSEIDYNDATGREKWKYVNVSKQLLLLGRGTENKTKRIMLVFSPEGVLEKAFVTEDVSEHRKGWFEFFER